MKVIYVAGPYRSHKPGGAQVNIQNAWRVALEVWGMGAAAICPHANTAHMDAPGFEDAATYLDGDIEIMRRCDAVVLMEGWQQSEGAKREAREAIKAGTPVFHSLDEVRDFVYKSQDSQADGEK